jgi:8-oxo-dGTP pyrophosphatase MutT (NUDIX family)
MTRAVVRDAIAAIEPFDGRESRDRDDALAWVNSGAVIYRVRKPDTPPKHLVSYFVLVDPDLERMLLVDHRNAGRWIPTGGHVEPGEDPRDTVRREASEELGIDAVFLERLGANPLFITQTVTAGLDQGHTDVSLWFVIAGRVGQTLQPDDGEFVAAEWWPFESVLEPGARVGPELPRFIAKLRAALTD